MKKSIKRLRISAETVRNLGQREIGGVRGGIITDTDPTSGTGGNPSGPLGCTVFCGTLSNLIPCPDSWQQNCGATTPATDCV